MAMNEISPASQHHRSIESCALRAKTFYSFFSVNQHAIEFRDPLCVFVSD